MKITSLPNDIELLKKMILRNNYRLELKSRELKEKRLEIERREMIIEVLPTDSVEGPKNLKVTLTNMPIKKFTEVSPI